MKRPDKRKKLTAKQVQAIRAERQKGKTLRELAKKYNVSSGHICHIIEWVSWK